MSTLAFIRNSIDTRDEYYDGEVKFFNEAEPILTEYVQMWNETLMESLFSNHFKEEYGNLIHIGLLSVLIFAEPADLIS